MSRTVTAAPHSDLKADASRARASEVGAAGRAHEGDDATLLREVEQAASTPQLS